MEGNRSIQTGIHDADERDKRTPELGDIHSRHWRKAFQTMERRGAVVKGMKIEKHKLIISRPTAWIGKVKLRPRELHTICVRFTLNRTQTRGYNVFFFWNSII
jgi:hypothetical protein